MKQTIQNTHWKKIVQVGAVVASMAIPSVALALEFGATCPTGINCSSTTNLNEFILRVINWILGVTLAIDVLFLIIGGFFYITSAGNEERATKGKTTVINAIIGLVIIVLSYVIANVVAGFFAK